MSEVFGAPYADAYDVIYRDKDDEGECDLIERLFRTYGDGSTHSILDLGCGTGRHSLILGQRGYQVLGVERSAGMLARALEKAKNNVKVGAFSGGGQVRFRLGDILDVNLEQQFDAALMMFAVLGYQNENSALLATLKNVRRHLRAGGLLIFDGWYGPAVLRERPSERFKATPTPTGQTLRAASGKLDTRLHLCTVRYQVWQLEEGRTATHAEEEHSMRYFFPLELEHFLECCGFSLLRLGAFPEFDREPDEANWNFICAARAVQYKPQRSSFETLAL